MEASVIVVTRDRPACIRLCLEHIQNQDYAGPFEIIVVDSSADDKTQAVLDDFPQVIRLRLHPPRGKTNLPEARNIALREARGEIVAFLDDDSYAHPSWLAQLMKHYQDPTVGGVGGRLIDPSRPPIGEKVGYFTVSPRIHLTANFVINTGQPVDVDHLSGGTMSFRKAILTELGGFDPHYTGGNQLEETDVCVRVKALGYRLVYEPAAVVDHLSVRSQAFRGRPGISHRFHEAKNWAYFLTKNFGVRFVILKNIFGGYPLLRFRQFFTHPTSDTLHQAVVILPGSLLGWVSGCAIRIRERLRP